jgi:hypothetical protein
VGVRRRQDFAAPQEHPRLATLVDPPRMWGSKPSDRRQKEGK